MAQASGSVATGTLSALCFALALAAGAGVAYYCVKRRRQEEQFGYFQVRVGGGVDRGEAVASSGRGQTGGGRGSAGAPWGGGVGGDVGTATRGSSAGGCGLVRGELRPPGGHAHPRGARPIPRLPFQADLRADEEEEEAAAPQQERGGSRAARLRPQRPLVAIPNPLYGGHAPDYEPLQVSPAPPRPAAARAPPRPAPPSPRSLPQDSLLADADSRRSPQ